MRTYRAARSAVVLALAAAFIVVPVSALSAGCGAAQTRSTVVTTAKTTAATVHGALNSLQGVFVEWDRQHQLDLVAAATTHESGEAALAAYRARRQKLYKLFAVAYAAIDAVAATVPLAEIDHVPMADFVALLTKAVTAVRDVQAALLALQGDAS